MTEDKILDKVRKILDKAEGTDNEAERQAFLTKAQQMMEDHAISQAQVEAARGSEKREPIAVFVEVNTRKVGGPAKGMMAVYIAKANRCQVVGTSKRNDQGEWIPGFQFQGMPDDAEFCEMLFTSLTMQAEQSYDPRKKPEWTHGRTYRASFMEGFYKVAGNRVETEAAKREQSRWESDGGSTALVLADVSKRIEDKFGKAKYSTRRQSSYDRAGDMDGRREGSRADLSGGRTKRFASKKQIGA